MTGSAHGPTSMVPTMCRVTDVRRETDDTFTIDVEAAGQDSLLPFAPGQFNMLSAFGAGEAAISISGPCADGRGWTHTIRRVGGVTNALGRLQPGDGIGVRGPFGRGWPVEECVGKDVVLVAGGVGLAPLRSVVLALNRARAKYRRVWLVYGARTPDDLLFGDEMDGWESADEIEVVRTVDHAPPTWTGEVGVVTGPLRDLPFQAADTVAMLCGPEIMMRYAAAELRARGLPCASVFVSLERNMKCGVGLCGHCQLGPVLVCRDGPVFPYDLAEPWMSVEEL